jgi:hypothetical protein
MPLRYADVALYVLAAAVPVVLLSLFGLFRWRYLRVVERALYAEGAASDWGRGASQYGIPNQPLTLVSERPVEATIDAGSQFLVAQREESAYRAALVLSGLVFVALAALLIWWGQTPRGNRAAVSIAYWCTLPGTVLVLVFAGRSWRATIASLIAWLAVGFLLHRVWLRISVSDTLTLFLSAIGFIGPPTLTVGLLALRAIRPVLVGLVPMVFVWLVTILAAAAVLGAAGISPDASVTPRAIAGGLAAAVLGIGLAVWQIRRELLTGSLALFIGLMLGGALLARFDGFRLASGMIAGVGFNGLVTAAIWWVFVRFVRFKANGHLPDEVLHYGFAWLGLTVLLPKYAGALDWRWSALPLVAFGLTLPPLLRRVRRRADTRAPRCLLLLRPFNNGRLRSDLLDALDASWRRVGTLDLVVGGDLAVRTLSGPVLESVLLGTVHRHFLGQLDEVTNRLAAFPRRAALDGRFPLNEVYCEPGVWQAVVTALADEADVVLMDLRGMRARNTGALFELRMAIQRVELPRIVLLADPRTDDAALTEVADEAWRTRSGNVADRVDPDPRLAVLRCSGHVARDNAWIVERVFAACGRDPGRLAAASG